jgi:hypothetical protein
MKSFINFLLEAYDEIPLTSDTFKVGDMYNAIYSKASGSSTRYSFAVPPTTENHVEVGIPHSADNLSLEQRGALNDYTEDSIGINNTLWRMKNEPNQYNYLSKIKDIDPQEFNEKIGKNVAKTLELHPEAQEDFHVFTGISHRDFAEHLHTHDITHMPSFISTSLNPYVAKSFSNITGTQDNSKRSIIRIKVRQGQQIGGYIQPHSNHASEEEFLVKPNQILHINNTPHIIQDTSPHTTAKIHVFDAHILTDDEISKLPQDHPEVVAYHRIKDLIK